MTNEERLTALEPSGMSYADKAIKLGKERAERGMTMDIETLKEQMQQAGAIWTQGEWDSAHAHMSRNFFPMLEALEMAKHEIVGLWAESGICDGQDLSKYAPYKKIVEAIENAKAVQDD